MAHCDWPDTLWNIPNNLSSPIYWLVSVASVIRTKIRKMSGNFFLQYPSNIKQEKMSQFYEGYSDLESEYKKALHGRTLTAYW